jgi:hypothetical protein
MAFAYINFVEGGGGTDPGYGQGRPGGGNVDNTLPIPNPAPGRPGNLPSVPPGWPVIPAHPIAGVPGGPRPDHTLPNPPPDRPGHLPSVPEGWPIIPARPWPPMHPDRPDHGLPGSGSGIPDNSLPTTPPPTNLPAGHTLVLVRTADGKWHYAAIEPGQPVPAPLPEPTPEPK